MPKFHVTIAIGGEGDFRDAEDLAAALAILKMAKSANPRPPADSSIAIVSNDDGRVIQLWMWKPDGWTKTLEQP